MLKNFSIDYSKLHNNIYKNAYRLSDVKDDLETVAFDVVKFKDGDKGADLWQIQSSDDGDYIVALYQSDEEKKTASLWDVAINKIAGNVEISYKGDPLVKISSSKLRIAREELDKVKSYLPLRLAEDKKLVRSLFNELTVSSRKEILKKYPELA